MQIKEFNKIDWTTVDKIVFLDLIENTVSLSVNGNLEYFKIPNVLNSYLMNVFQIIEKGQLK